MPFLQKTLAGKSAFLLKKPRCLAHQASPGKGNSKTDTGNERNTKIMADFIPTTDEGLIPWLTNLKTKIPTYTATLGITAPRVLQITGWCTALDTSIQTVGQKKADWLSATAAKQTQMDTSIGGLRAEIGLWKKNAAMTDAIAADLQIVGTSEAFDPEAYKAEISAEAFSGYVRIKFKKRGVDGVNIYSRKRGEMGWKFLARDTNSPYDDHTPLTTPGTPETREYQAFGVLGDEQIGQGSDLASATFAG
jgi:hypothetical protein